MIARIQRSDIYMSRRGAGPAVLFLHGAPDSAELWDGVIKRLEDRYQCFAPDLPGFGRTATPKDFVVSLDYMARFIDDLVEVYEIPLPLHLVVMDFGATYGLAWAVKHPEKVRSIVIAGGSNFSAAYQWHRDAQMLRTPLLGELGMLMMSRATLEKMMQKNAPGLSQEYVRQEYALSLRKAETRRMMLRLYRGINPQDFVGWEERLAALTAHVPTYVLWGDKDPFAAPAAAERFGQAHVEHFSQYGHWLPVEAPAIVAARVATIESN
jgi:pimeloyl-ACP methyl ester carboxylesterase